MSYRLQNQHSTLTYHDGTLIFTDKRTGKTLTLGGGDEFVLYLCDKEGQTTVLRDSDCRLIETQYTEGVHLSFLFIKDDVTVKVSYQAQNTVFDKIITVHMENGEGITLRRITVENRRAFAPVTRGGEGQPIFIGNGNTAHLFCGTEFPVANNLYDGSTLSCTQAPYAELVEAFNSISMVYGLDTCGDLASTFLSYIRGKLCGDGNPLRIYCDWGLHDDLTPGEPTMSAALTLENIPRVAELNRKSGVSFDYYLMDAFWFEKGKPYTEFDSVAFPEGMDKIKAALDETGLKLGLWFDINGIHTRLAERPELAQYNAELGNGALCLSCDQFAELICRGMEKQIRELDVQLIKLDFGYFECKNPQHNHSTDFTESKEKAVKNFIYMMNHLRTLQPDLKILAYNGWMTELGWMNTPDPDRRGFAISPYWCEHVDYIYCGDPRPSEFPSENAADSLVWYTDGMIKLFSDALVPPEAIDDDGAMMGHTATIYRLGKSHFRQSILMDLMRGGHKLMIYGDLRDLDDSDHAYLSLVNALFERAMAGQYTTHIVGNAARGEIYGYDTGNEIEGLCVVVNPTSHDVTYNLSSPRWQSGVMITSVIIDGEPVLPVWQETGNSAVVRVSAHGYTLIEWKLTPIPKGADTVTLLPGDKIILVTEGKHALELSFRIGGNPLKTVTGLPPQFTVTSEGKELPTSLTSTVWAGISWAHFALPDHPTVTLTNGSDLTFTVKYQLK
ncbi:MAG: hypothetical protein E7661_04395 [Ruminococcaceae bacterium]|nr:hypothetical protein [Oscillospiraceae bacterium]